MEIRFSTFTINHYDAVIALWHRSKGIGLSGADSRENIDIYLKRNPGMSSVAYLGKDLIGAILCGHDGRRGYIHHLAVDPDYRRRGIAQMLVEKALAALKRETILKCHIFVFKANTDGIAFWKHIGWTHRDDIGMISKEVG